jgi:hypothetical protein
LWFKPEFKSAAGVKHVLIICLIITFKFAVMDVDCGAHEGAGEPTCQGDAAATAAAAAANAVQALQRDLQQRITATSIEINQVNTDKSAT